MNRVSRTRKPNKNVHAHCVTGYTLPSMLVISAIKSMISAGETGANYITSMLSIGKIHRLINDFLENEYRPGFVVCE